MERQAEELQSYRFGENREHWNAMDAKVRHGQQRERERAEEVLVEVLRSADSTPDAQILACRGLKWVGRSSLGTNVSGYTGVPILIAVLRNPRLSSEACMALQEKTSPDINPALREALPLVEPALKEQIMITLGRRRDGEAVPIIARLASSIDDPQLRRIAVEVLGQIGGRQALAAIEDLSNQDLPPVLVSRSILAAASRSLTLSPDDRSVGLAALRRLAVKAPSPTVRLGALYEWAVAAPDERLALCRQALTSREDSLLDIVPGLLALLDAEAIQTLYQDDFFSGLGPHSQTLLVEWWRPEFGQVDKIRALSVEQGHAERVRKAARRVLDLWIP